MLMGLTETMAAGEMRNVTLTFASGHSVTLSAMVMKPGEIGGKGQSNTHAAGNHN
jgi:copper(I)-binding protein